MKQFVITGGEYIDPMIPESFVTFGYPIQARTRTQAIEMFHVIFPGCVMVEII